MGILRTDKISGLETPTAVTGSVNFPGSDDYITAPANTPELLLGDADFTIEGWFYKTGTGQQDAFGLYETANNRRSYLLTTDDSSTIFYYNYTGSSGTSVSTGFTLPLNKWAHVAITRDGTTLKIYVDGKLSGTTTGLTSGAYANTDDQFMIGSSDYSNANSSEWTGHISNLRIVKGYVLYDGDFTAPDHALEVVPGTVLLACNNPDSVTAVESALIGKGLTLTAVNDVAISSINPGLTRDFTSGTEFNGVTTFDTQGYFVPPSGTTTQRGRGHAVFGGGENPSNVNVIYSINISSSGIAENFGDLTIARKELGGCASSTRGVFAGGSSTGESPAPPFSRSNVIDYVTLATEGNAADFGDLTGLHDMLHCGLSNSTRGIWAGGEMPSAPSGSNVIQYVTIAALGNAQDFGDLIRGTDESTGCASPTRGIIFGNGLGEIQYITISTLGNAIDFGDHNTNSLGASCSDSTRGMIGGGTSLTTGGTINTIDYVTITTLGNVQDFGDLTVARKELAAVSNSIRGVFGGGHESGNTIDYVIIQTTGNAQDFGDLPISGNSQEQGSASDSHGGIS